MTLTLESPTYPPAAAAARKINRKLHPEITPQERMFGRRLKALRIEAGFSAVEFAAKLGVSQPTLWAYENGLSAFAYWRLPAIARALGRTPSDLIARLFPDYETLEDQPPKTFRGPRRPQ